MRNFRRVILPLAILLAAVWGVNTGLNYALIPYSYVRILMHQTETQAYENVILGTSHALSGINPRILSEETGEKSINLAMGGEFPLDSYYFLKKVCETHMPKRVVYELDPGYWCTPEGQIGDFNRIFNEMTWSAAKLEYFMAKTMKADFRAALFPWFYYRNQISNMKSIIETKQSEGYKNYGVEPFREENQAFEDGFIKIKEMPGPKAPNRPVLWNASNLQPDAEKYFKKMAAFCRKKGIQLIVITTPVPLETRQELGEYAQADQYFENYMSRLGIPYWNYNKQERQIEGFDYSQNAFSDYEGHMTGRQAEIFTKELANYLKKMKH